MPHTRTPSRPGMVAVGGPTAPKDVEAAFDGHMRDAGVSFDAAGLALNLTGEALRTMQVAERHVGAGIGEEVERQRVLVELHFFQGLSQGEIARQLGITGRAITGAEFAAWSDDEALKQIDGMDAMAKVQASIESIFRTLQKA